MDKTKPTAEQVAAGKARAGGNTATSTELVDKVSTQAKNATPVPGRGGTGRLPTTGLDGRPLGSPIYAGETTSMPPQFAGGRPIPGQFITKKTQYYRGAGMTYLQTLTNKQRIDALSRLAQIPGAYANPKDAPTAAYLQNLAATGFVAVRPEDAAAVEKLMYISDTVGENIEDTITRFYSDPKLAKQTLDISGLAGKKVKLTPADALRAELNQSMMDFLDIKADKKIADEYVDTINKLELKRGGAITSLERSQLLFDAVQKKALEVFKDDKAPDSLLLRKGAVGGTFNVLRKTYEDFGIPVDEKSLYKQAITGTRSRQALENILQKIGVQAEVAFPALTDYIRQGLTTKEALATYAGIRSKILGIPETAVQISDMYPVFKGKELMTPKEWENYLYTLPEYKQSPLFKQRQTSDARALLNNFFGGAA